MPAPTRDMIETPEGLRFPVDPVIPPRIRRALQAGRYEDKEARAVAQLLRQGDRVLEIGGGVGYMSSMMAKRRDLEAIETYEANPALAAYIPRVHAENGLGHIIVRNALLTPEAAPPATFYVRHNILASSMSREADPDSIAEEVEIPCEPVAEVTERLRPTFLVCDIEGAEATLLPAMDLSSLRAAVVELHPQWIGQAGVQAVFDAFARAGLSYFPKTSHAKVVSFKRGF